MNGDDLAGEFPPKLFADFSPSHKSIQFWSEDRLLKFLIFGMLLFFIALTVVFYQQANLRVEIDAVRSTQTELAQAQEYITDDRDIGRENGYRNRSVSCMVLIVDNDRTFPLPDTCTLPEILKYYPPVICSTFGAPQGCGTDFIVSPYPDPIGSNG